MDTVDGYRRLRQVTKSPIFGPAFAGEHLLTVGKDSLSVALKMTFPEWNVENLTSTAYQCASDSDDFSLVALAALSREPVALTALRESVVLYAMALGGYAALDEEPQYVWAVDEVVQTRSARFVATFNELFGESLPEPVPENAKQFWIACDIWKIIGRCVRIGYDDSVRPVKHYHWAIDRDAQYNPTVGDFWDTDIWTTQRYREKLDSQY